MNNNKENMETSLSMKAAFLLVQGIISWLLLFAGLNSEAFYILSVLLIIDFMTGIWKAHALEQNVTSNKMKYGVISKLSLLIIPIAIGLGVRALGQSASQLLLISINILILSEMYSIIGNIYSARTGQELPEFDALSMIAKSIRKRLGG
jgi:phage-related holin